MAQSSGTGGGSPRRPLPRPRSAPDASEPEAAASSPAPPAPPQGPDRRRAVLPLAAFVLLLVAVVSTAYALVALPKHGAKHRSTPVAKDTSIAATTPPGTAGDTSTTPPAGATADTALVAWMKTALPKNAPIVAAESVAPALRGAGFTAVAAEARPGNTAGRASGTYWLVSTAAADGGLAVPVARFGAGSTDTRVGLMLANATAARRDVAVASDRSNRLTADSQLAENAAVRTDSQVRSMLRRGELDTRAATMLALLGNFGPLRVRSLPIDPAESAVGRPARTVVLDASADALARARNQMQPHYRPATMAASGRSTMLVWNVAVDPVRTVS